MSHFYGTLRGSRGEATRCGTKKSGILTQTASWAGAVQVWLYYDKKTGRDMACVALTPWRGNGTERQLYSGPINPDTVDE